MKNYYYKRRNVLNHLINRVEELMLILISKLLSIMKVF